jgi:AraC family transcriptional regulator, transcriptional activator of pobA
MVSMTDSLKKNGFTAYVVESHWTRTQYRGRDAYHKMLFISGIGQIEYDDAIYHINGSVLLFTKPTSSCRWSLSNPHHSTYVCAFDNHFVDSECTSWSELCVGYFASTPLFHLNAGQENLIKAIFCRMVEEQKSSYAFKDELINNHLCVLKHMALRMTAVTKSVCSIRCASPSCVVLLELVESGFPLAGQALHLN